jgi:hypothetical protein
MVCYVVKSSVDWNIKPDLGRDGVIMMKRSVFLISILIVAAALLVDCGSDDLSPGDPAASSVIPDIVFFNITGSAEVILFEGRATDNRWIETVLISFNNGATWNTAEIDDDPPNSVRDVHWSYLASDSDMPSPSTVLIRAIDQDANETTSAPFTVQKASGSTIGSLQSLFSGAADGDVIALSSGRGSAYGNNAAALSIPINVDLTVLGAGYGDTATSGAVPLPAVASTATILEASITSASIFSIEDNFTLRQVRLIGAVTGISIAGTPGGDPFLSIEDCLFDGQDAWAVFAMDDDSEVTVDFLSSIVDASSASSSGRGGLYLEDVTYNVSDSEFHLQTDPMGPSDATVEGAGVQIFGGDGTVTESVFMDNALAIWASGGSPVISFCSVSGATALTTYGINLTGGPGPAVIRRNTVDSNSGYGLRIGGEMELVLRRNAITNNEFSGVLIDSELSNVNLINIDMGTLSDQGRNLLDDNIHPDGNWAFDTQVYVTQDTNAGSTPVPANYNYWGYFTISDINTSIVDNGDQGGSRATIAVGNYYITTSEVGP